MDKTDKKLAEIDKELEKLQKDLKARKNMLSFDSSNTIRETVRIIENRIVKLRFLEHEIYMGWSEEYPMVRLEDQ
tara:strand:- start:248 stop:472 length:225 start_codon:yes stop_codon:yes gene_type:complete